MSRQKYIQGVKYVAVAALAATLMVGLPAAPNAAIFNFALHDHPDGELVNPIYGLRLDGLFGASSTDFTFTFDTSGASSFLDYATPRTRCVSTARPSAVSIRAPAGMPAIPVS